jgi:hypothetical protein
MRYIDIIKRNTETVIDAGKEWGQYVNVLSSPEFRAQSQHKDCS